MPSLSHFWGSIFSYCASGDPLSCNLFSFRLSPFQHFDLWHSSSSRNLGLPVWLSHTDSILSAPSWAHRPASSLPFPCDGLCPSQTSSLSAFYPYLHLIQKLEECPLLAQMVNGPETTPPAPAQRGGESPSFQPCIHALAPLSPPVPLSVAGDHRPPAAAHNKLPNCTLRSCLLRFLVLEPIIQ